jgi:tetratricopeptide (TPR) repeat protein
MPLFIVKTPDETPHAYEFEYVSSITIGRSHLNELCLDDPLVSGVHARVSFRDDQYFLEDLGSESGTYYDGRFISQPVSLQSGGQIYVGRTEIEFQIESQGSTLAEEVESTERNLLLALEGIDADTKWLATAFFRRAAKYYEAVGLWHEAANCWIDAGNASDAIELYLRTNDYERAAPLLMEKERYAEALRCYRSWIATLKRDDPTPRIRALLGVALSLTLMKAEPEAASAAYRQARSLAETHASSDASTAGSCWEALGVYGAKVGRTDLVQIAYEEALNTYGSDYNDDRIRVGWDYLSAVQNNRLLVAEIEAKLAEWAPQIESPSPTTPGPASALLLGARFGQWTIWRPGAKEVVLVHAQSGTGIEIWADSWGWFRWSKGKDGYLVRSDGSITSNLGPVNIQPYVESAPAEELSQVSADVINYTFNWSKEQLRIHNKVKGGVIVVTSRTNIFEFVSAEGRAKLMGN